MGRARRGQARRGKVSMTEKRLIVIEPDSTVTVRPLDGCAGEGLAAFVDQTALDG